MLHHDDDDDGGVGGENLFQKYYLFGWCLIGEREPNVAFNYGGGLLSLLSNSERVVDAAASVAGTAY